MRISDNVRVVYPNRDALDELERLYETAASLKAAVVRASDISPVAKLPLKILVLFQVGLRRSLELADSFGRDLNGGLFAPVFVNARALLETIALLYEIWLRVERVVTAWDRAGLKDLDERSMAALLGSKTLGWGADPQQFQALNILTILDRLTKTLGPAIRKFYDALSEHAHPNYAGMLGAYQKPDREAQQSILIDKPAMERPELLILAVNAVTVALQILIRTIQDYQRILHDFTRLCEEDIFEGGTWPTGLAYPLHPPRPN